MVRFMTYVTLLTLALMALTCLVSANPDPADVAAQAIVENSPKITNEKDEPPTDTNEATTDAKAPVIHNTGAISDSISKVTTETPINTPNPSSPASSSKPGDSTSALKSASATSALTHVTPSIALASIAAIAIINLLV
ncbi:unnamed protein product [Peronospora farinosa]|uniref:Uncharacterized protein n=1 Tax=Peronospora farinosa TaxID=134698 RepID=A0AAV0UAF9_9STRA|nr:unnamed protein product [Peronospora farinosa]CAI5731919.1 unnamed protein product [Peronospora farinosa]